MKANKLLFVLALLALCLGTPLYAQTPGLGKKEKVKGKIENIEDSPGYEKISEPGDANKGEKTVLKVLFKKSLVRKEVTYNDGRVVNERFDNRGVLEYKKTTLDNGTIENESYFNGKLSSKHVYHKNGVIQSQIFRNDATLETETEYQPGGQSYKTTSYLEDGSGKKQSVDITPTGAKIITAYWKDGKTVYCISKKQHAPGDAQYTDKHHQLTVFDTQGKELYKQEWIYANAWRLSSITETTSSGAQRRLIFKQDLSIEKAEYLKPDGSIDKVEPGDKLSEPFDQERLKEIELEPRNVTR